MRIIYPRLWMTAILASLTSCVETIVMDPHEENLPVVVNYIMRCNPEDSYMIRRYQQKLHLYYAKGKSQKDYQPVENADVYVLNEISDTTCKFTRTSGTLWEGLGGFRPGHSYTLIINIPGRKSISSSIVTPHPFGVVSGYGTMGILGGSGSSSEASAFPDNDHAHKLWIFAHRGIHKDDESDDDAFEYFMTDNPYADDFNVTGEKYSDLKIEGTPGERYRLFWLWFKKRQAMMPDIPIHSKCLRIDLPANYRNGKSEKERAEGGFAQAYDDFLLMCGPLECPTEESIYQTRTEHYDVYSVSEEYDRLLRELYLKDGLRHHDLTSVYSTDNVNSNIKNGLGIFGAYILHPREVYH